MDGSNGTRNQGSTGIFDISLLVENAWKGLKQYWWIFLIIISLCSSRSYFKAKSAYSPYYKASSTFIVNMNQSVTYSADYYNNATASQMGKTFPYILNSGVLMEVVASDLGVASVGESITAEAMEDSNLFELSVTGSDPQRAYDVLQSVIKNYPVVAEFVIGDTQLHILDETGVPEEPENAPNFMSAAKQGAKKALIICLFILAVYATTRNTIRREEDLKKILNIRCLGSMPLAVFKKRSSAKKELILLDNKKISPGFLESSRSLRTRILKECREKGLKTILITSSMPGEGKSTVATNLALSLVQKGNSVVLVDGDLRNPSLAGVLGFKKEDYSYGFGDVVIGKAHFEDALIQYKDTKLSLLLGAEPIESTERLLSRRTTKEVLMDAAQAADYVLIDTPPGGMLADASILSNYADGALFVVRQDFVRKDRIVEAVQNIADTGIAMVGCILNGAETGIIGYGSGYSRYGSRYGSGNYGYGYGYGMRASKGRSSRKASEDEE